MSIWIFLGWPSPLIFQIPSPPSLRNWYRRRMRHEERLKVFTLSQFCLVIPHFVSFLSSYVTNPLFWTDPCKLFQDVFDKKLSSWPTMFSIFHSSTLSDCQISTPFQEGITNTCPPAMPRADHVFQSANFKKFANLYLKLGHCLGAFQVAQF